MVHRGCAGGNDFCLASDIPACLPASQPDMTCSACPITVKVVLNRVEGVNAVDVRYEERDATVTFDDAKTSVEALTQATTNAGYPSTLKQSQATQE
ncbi:MAG: mercury resistance system periplasmic binding protein MerP [Marinobacter psychrophilus]|jgi:mercuric ion binding protein|nr:mercury resistance system periplasmic binding protein MerP [Marinobacter psychrophilus]MBQ0762188.1 mercury resistance system periplasmic binding protein MerP [Marinobacter psychrophilus]MBQ0843762.1 mercury resistance system periplasmic binding protein MerP [Marinobacter psychrophilus]